MSRFPGRFGEVAAEDMSLPVPDDLHPNAGVRVRRRRRLHAIAARHGGCFTAAQAAQAAQAGYDRRARHHHLSYGNWRRTDAPQVFRLTGWPIDRAEPLHAWLLWAGTGSALTSWSGLDLHGVTDLRLDLGSTPGAPIDVAHAATKPRRARLAPAEHSDAVRLHRQQIAHLPPLFIGDLPVRPIEECLCVALQTSAGPVGRAAANLTESLVDAGTVELLDVLEAARHLRVPKMLDLLWPRLRTRHRPAG